MICHGWQIYFHPLFAERFRILRRESEGLKTRLTAPEYQAHPRVRLLASVVHLIRDIVPVNPNAPEFRLRDELAKFRRAKSHGLPERYRLFWIFSSTARSIIFIYLNDESSLRKEGSRSDPYELFKAMIRQGKVGENYEANWTMLDDQERSQNPPSLSD